jgi:Pyruvate/2-oxoacid:ferredoxin oxidoreductase gamma subunit
MLLDGLKDGGVIIYNYPYPENPISFDGYETYVVDAHHISMEVIGYPIYNTTMLGALVGATKIVDSDFIIEVIRSRFGGRIGDLNVKAALKGMEEVRRVV